MRSLADRRHVNRNFSVLFAVLGIFFFSALNVQAGTLYAVNEDSNSLVSIDTDSLAYTSIGPLGVTFEFGGLAYDPNSDILYMIGGRGNNNLYTVDRTTGQATLIGSHGINDLFGLAYDSTNNVLYASQFSGGSSLYVLNTSTGASTLIGNMGTGMGGLAYNSTTDTLIGINDGSGDLYEIDRTNASITLIYDGGSTNDSGLAYDPDKNYYWDIDWNGNLYSYDIADGFTRTTRLSGLGRHDGLAYISDSAPPTTYTMIYNGNGNTDGTAPVDPSSPYAAGSIVTVLDEGDLVRSGYTFNNWNTAADGSGTPYAPGVTFSMPESNVVLYAQWSSVPQPIPTMSEWGMIIMSLILAGSAIWMMRRRRVS